MAKVIIIHEKLKPDLVRKRMEIVNQAYWGKEAITVYLDEELIEMIVQEEGEKTLRLFIEGYNLGRSLPNDCI